MVDFRYMTKAEGGGEDWSGGRVKTGLASGHKVVMFCLVWFGNM